MKMTVDLSVKKEISRVFGNSLAFDEDIIDKLSTIKHIFNISSDELYVNWETYNVSEVQKDLELTTDNLEKFQEYLQNTLATKNTPSLRKVKDIPSNSIKRKPIRSGVPSTPHLKKTKKESLTPYETPKGNFLESSPADYDTANDTFQTPKGLEKIEERESKREPHAILETLNPQLEEVPGFITLDEDPSTTIKPFRFISNYDVAKYKFRTMSMKLLESADVLDEQIDSMAHLYEQALGQAVQFGNPCLSSQFSALCCGRIVPDSPLYDVSDNYALNSTTLFLETSRISGIGQRISLDLSNLSEYSYFPGQIVILRGRNPTGKAFVVEENIELPKLGAPLSTRQEMEDFSELTEQGNLKVVIASGPFSNSQNLNYEKFEAFVDRINTEIKPHVVLLFGPFLDLTNESVKNGDIDFEDSKQAPRSLEDVFRKVLTPIIKKIDLRIQVIMVPSLKDAVIKHCSYPQDSFDRKKFGLPKNVKIAPNPSNFSLNEILIGSSNLDALKDIREVYTSNVGESKLSSNRFERIINHILDQRRYYPVFPGSINKIRSNGNFGKDKVLSDGVMRDEIIETNIGGSTLEVPYLGLSELGETLPDIIVIPSELRYFAKVIRGVVAINPGSFTRPHRDPTKEEGTYVIMNVKPPIMNDPVNNIESTDDSNEFYFHNIHKRTRVDIFRS